MNVRELMPHIEARALTGETGLDNPVSAGYACDLLSWVMAMTILAKSDLQSRYK